MSRRRNRIEILEDMFSDLDLAQQASLLQVFNGLHRQKQRNGAALNATATKPPASLAKPQQPAPPATDQATLPIDAAFEEGPE